MKKRAFVLVLALALVCALGGAALAAEDFEGTVLYDAGGVTVTVEGYDPEGEWGPVFDLSLKNGSRWDVDISMDLVSVNGVMCEPNWSVTVPAGKTAESQAAWYAGDLANVGVNWIEEVEAVLTVRPSGGEGADDIFSDKVRWSAPAGEGPAVTEPVFDSGFEPVAVSEGDLAVTAVGYDPDGDEGPAVLFRVDNGSDKDLWLHMDDARANGVLSQPYWSVTVAAGKTAYGWCQWDDRDRAGDALREVSFTMEAVDWHTLETLDRKDAGLTLPASEAPEPTAVPEGTPATEAGVTGVMGKVKLDRYENPYFGLAFEPGEDWHFMTDEELRAMQSMSAALLQGTDAEGYMDTIVGGYAAAAGTLDGRMNVSMMIQHVQGLSGAADQDSFLDLVLGDVETDADGNMTIPGMASAAVRRDTVTLAGRELPALSIEADGAIGMTVHQRQVYVVRGDWFMQISLTSLRDEEGLEEMAALFEPLPE